jgi:hypothetical protein
MDRRERYEDLNVALIVAQEGWQAAMWTALPGIIQSFDPVKMTCTVQAAIQVRAIDQTGAETWIQISVLVDCPVVFPSGGGFTLSFPLAAGDECLVVFASRCIDHWWEKGGIQQQAELRMHDLSDGFVLPGVKSQPRVIPGISTTAVQLRNDAGDAYVEIQADKDITVVTPATATVTAPGGITLNGNVTVNGSLTATGTVQAPNVVGTTNVTFGGKSGIATRSYRRHDRRRQHGSPSMRYRKLSTLGDYSFGHASQFYVDEKAAVAQAISTRLKLLTGEWFLDTKEGTPYFGKILGHQSAGTRDIAIRDRILNTPGVKSITNYASAIDANRKFTVSVKVDSIYGAVQVSTTL